MKPTQISFDAQDLILFGARQSAHAVASTLGPKGRNVILKIDDRMHTTKDGVTVARFIKLEDPRHAIGSTFVLEAANRTVRDAGDGTTTASLLTYKLMKHGLEAIKSGVNPVFLVQGMREAVGIAVEEIQLISQPLDDDYDLIEKVATISANNDPELGKMITQAMREVGREGMIQAGEHDKPETELVVTNGFAYDQGYASPLYINKPQRAECFFEGDVKVVIVDDDISTHRQVMNLFQYFGSTDTPFVMVCNSLVGEARDLFDINVRENGLRGCYVEAVGAGDRRTDYLIDMACFLGGGVWGRNHGHSLESFDVADPEAMAMLGSCNSFVAAFRDTRFVLDVVEAERIEERVTTIEALQRGTADEFAITKYGQRIARLRGKAAKIMVGASTAQELGAKKDQLDDAIKATKASVESGIVPGGGTSFLKAIDKLVNNKKGLLEGPQIVKESDKAVASGYQVVIDVLPCVLSKICDNGGIDAEGVIRELEITRGKSMGYDAKQDQVVNMIDAGIVNPTKVDVSALRNAVSAAAMFLLTSAVIYNTPEK